MLLCSPPNWIDYELIDSGDFEKLERFGSYTLARPEPQAIWPKKLSDQEWNTLAHGTFRREKGAYTNERGEWSTRRDMPGQWWISYPLAPSKTIKFRLGLTSFKHVGIFPEQADNWQFIYNKILSFEHTPKVLNLFAYTGGASLAARAAGAEVVHVDSVKQVITWSRENMEESNLDGIRWVVEDALKFVVREERRGNLYDGIILDPPAYGRGPDGEKWVLEDNLLPLLESCKHLLSKNGFLVLNLYSMGFSSLVAKNIVERVFERSNVQYGELFIPDKHGIQLPLGVFCRF